MFDKISFAHPWLLLLLLLIPLMIVRYVLRHKRIKPSVHIPSLSMFGDDVLTVRHVLYHVRFGLRCLVLTLLIIALARPQSKLSREEMQVEGIDIVLAVDVSTSMLAEDFRPNRLEAAKEVEIGRAHV